MRPFGAGWRQPGWPPESVTVWRSVGRARRYARLVAVSHFLLALFGLIPALNINNTFGLVPIHGNDVWLHVLLAPPAAYFGCAHRHGDTAPAVGDCDAPFVVHSDDAVERRLDGGLAPGLPLPELVGQRLQRLGDLPVRHLVHRDDRTDLLAVTRRDRAAAGDEMAAAAPRGATTISTSRTFPSRNAR